MVAASNEATPSLASPSTPLPRKVKLAMTKTTSLTCALGLLTGVALLAPAPAAADPYLNTSNTPFTNRFQFIYHGILSVSGGPYTPARGYFKLRNGSPDSSSGGWLQLSHSADIPLSPLAFNDNSAIFPMELSEELRFYTSVPASLRDLIHVDVTITSSPRVLGPLPATTQTFFFPLTVRSLEQAGGAVFGQTLRNTLETSCAVRWVDQQIKLKYEVYLDASIADPLFTGTGKFTREYQLNTRRNPLGRVSPFLLPVALVGQPPGNRSWSRLTTGSASGVGLAVANGSTTSTTTQTSYGFGPFSVTDPAVTVTRNSSQRIQQTYSAHGALNLMSHDPSFGPAPFGPGRGDLMYCLVRPTFNLYRALADMDFRYVSPASNGGTQGLAYFRMNELLNPQSGTPPFYLNPAEKAAIQALNPLLADPRAQLPTPRFYKVMGPISGQGGSLGGQFGSQSVTRSAVENAVGRSTTVDNSVNVNLPLGAIASAVGLALPIPEAGYRSTDTTTSTVELRTTDLFESAQTTLVEFQFGDDDPRKWIFTEVYYDTLFRTFLFRDASPAPLMLDGLRRNQKLDEIPLPRWMSLILDEKTSGNASAARFLVAGSLRQWAPSGGRAILTLPGKNPIPMQAAIPKGTGNVVFPSLAPGAYDLKAVRFDIPGGKGDTLHRLVVSTNGAVTFD